MKKQPTITTVNDIFDGLQQCVTSETVYHPRCDQEVLVIHWDDVLRIFASYGVTPPEKQEAV